MQNRRYKFFSFLCLFVLASVTESNAQSPTSSPYSRFGLGDFAPNKIFAQSAALGGSSLALKNDTLLPLFINPNNPASYTGIRLTTFEVGLNSIFNQYSNNTATSQGNNTSFNYLALAFPIRQNMGACIGVMPASSVGYKITETNHIENIGSVTELYEGDGGVNNLFIGVSGAPFGKSLRKFLSSKSLKELNDSGRYDVARKKLFVKRWLSSFSVGANGYYYFGTINNVSRVIYPTQSNFFNTAQLYQTQVKSFTGSFGIQNTFTIDGVRSGKDTVKSSPTYGKNKRRDLKENIEISWGYTYSMNNDLRAYYSNFAYTFLYKGNGINEYVRDTINFVEDMRTNITLPTMHGVGISIRKGNKLNIVADYEMQLWSGFKYLNEKAQFTDMKRISIGAEYIPHKLANTKGTYWKKIQYRAGVKYNDGKLMINNKRVNEYGVTLGLGLPVGMNRALNTFNLGVELGQVGSKDLVEHKYIQVKLGFTFNDRWFIKYKYD